MNNIVLDVAIGIVFIYLLYSLLATTINEFIAMTFAYRHRMLEKAIEQMLDGKNYSYYWWHKIGNFFLWLFQDTKTKQDKDESQKTVEGVNIKDYFKTCNINSTRPKETHLKRLQLNKKASLFAANITNHPLYRRKSEDSILFKKPAYLSASAFSDILFDVLSNKRSEINSSPILMNDIKAFVSNQLENNRDLKSILNLYIEQANGDVQKFKLLLEDWFDDTMSRVSGWYKRQATKVLFAIGILLAFAFNVNTIEIVNKLSVNEDLRKAMSEAASGYVKERTKSSGVEGKSPTVNSKDLLDSAKNQIQDIQKLYKDTIADINMMMGLGWGDFGHARKYTPIVAEKRRQDSVLLSNAIKDLSGKKGRHNIVVYEEKMIFGCVRKNLVGSFNVPTDSKLISDSLKTFLNSRYKVKGEATLLEKIIYVLTNVTLEDIIGFIITALAITLGAPFWFDLLNKFVNIRAGGNKPSEDTGSSNGTAVSKTVTLNQKPSPNSFA